FIHTPIPAIYTLSLHDALPIYSIQSKTLAIRIGEMGHMGDGTDIIQLMQLLPDFYILLRLETQTVHATVHFQEHIKLCVWRYFRSEEHTSELQSRENLVCRLLL